MVKVKICGITNREDADFAVSSGVNALGFIFAPSPRQISPETARDIISSLPPFVSSVGVFVNEDPPVIREIMDMCGLDFVQFHGNEPPDMCREFMPRAIKALSIKDDSILKSSQAYKGSVKALVLDTYSKKMAGGTGRTFDWDIALGIKNTGMTIILAGGIGPANIEEAISYVNPFSVDVNSAIEKSPGRKDHALIMELMEKVALLNISTSFRG